MSFEEQAQMQNKYSDTKAVKAATLYEQHEQAVKEYHLACRQFQQAAEARERANNQLQKLTQVLAEHIQMALYDPTVPQPPCPPPMNGGANSAGLAVGMPRY